MRSSPSWPFVPAEPVGPVAPWQSSASNTPVGVDVFLGVVLAVAIRIPAIDAVDARHTLDTLFTLGALRASGSGRSDLAGGGLGA